MSENKESSPNNVSEMRHRLLLIAIILATVMSFLAVGLGRLVDMGEGFVAVLFGMFIIEILSWRIRRLVWRALVTLSVLLYGAGLVGLWHFLLCRLPVPQSIRPEFCHAGAIYATVGLAMLGPILILIPNEIVDLLSGWSEQGKT